jgi:hypothetical protein
MSIFAKFSSYGYIHHRALNDFAALGEARALVRGNPGRVHIYEGDICWDFTAGREDLYFRHPDFVFDTLSDEQIDKGKRERTLVTLEDLEALKGDDAFVVVELKVGKGSTAKALEKVLAFLNRHFPGRFWIDGFSLTLLKQVKEIAPETTVTLHTECVMGEHVVAAAPQWPQMRIVNLYDLDFVDGVAIRWRVGANFMRQGAEGVRGAGKALLISRIHDLDRFRNSLEWGAVAGYAHYDFRTLVLAEDEFRRNAKAGVDPAGD